MAIVLINAKMLIYTVNSVLYIARLVQLNMMVFVLILSYRIVKMEISISMRHIFVLVLVLHIPIKMIYNAFNPVLVVYMVT